MIVRVTLEDVRDVADRALRASVVLACTPQSRIS